MSTTIKNQPLSDVRWIETSELRANDYNPNHVAPPEMRLLAISIIENGWTQPIVARPDGEIVDGFHRWTVAQKNPEVAEITGGLVPVVYLASSLDQATQEMATIRHNRARGSHYVVRMADIVNELHHDHGLSREEIAERLQMEDEEVDRLMDHGHKPDRGSNENGFNKGWKPSLAASREKWGD